MRAAVCDHCPAPKQLYIDSEKRLQNMCINRSASQFCTNKGLLWLHCYWGAINKLLCEKLGHHRHMWDADIVFVYKNRTQWDTQIPKYYRD